MLATAIEEETGHAVTPHSTSKAHAYMLELESQLLGLY